MCHADSPAGDAPAVAEHEVEVEVAGGAMPATLFLPPAGAGPGIEVLSDVYGRLPFYRGLAARLAADGYVVLLPDYFFRQGPLSAQTREAAFARHARLDEELSIRDHAAAVAWLRKHPAADGDRVGLLGFCLGGTIALDLCADGLNAAVVCYYAFPFGFGNPCVRKAPRPIDLATKVTAPVLAHWGDADYIPLSEVSAFTAAMRAAGNPYTDHVYAGAGHGFLTGLVESRPDSAAARESWARTTEFFARELRGQP